MMMITKLKELMSLNGEMNAAEIESRCLKILRYKREKKSIFLKRLSFTSTISIIVTLSLIPVSPILYTGT